MAAPTEQQSHLQAQLEAGDRTLILPQHLQERQLTWLSLTLT